ncbi:MAG: cytochrome c oxidase subunit II [Actinobacteria bacterium]|nr:cytochrome c oxidase subunit II [Actinomycetota bacterium]
MAKTRRVSGTVAVGAVLAVTPACSSQQSTLDPASDSAGRIADLWWVMLVGSAVVFAVVTALVLVAVLRRRGAHAEPGRASRLGDPLIAIGGVGIPAVVLVSLFVLTVRTLPVTSAPAPGATRLRIEVTGRQWFWEVRYPGRNVVTANELVIPVDVPVEVRVSTQDVIHSFWVPRLNRKIDLIPGHASSVLLRAEKPGVYRGQCAEFCGLQHANMAFLVVAQPPERFRAWLARERRPAGRPRTPALERGRRVFFRSACAGCHRIAGTAARGDAGPDLTHLGARRTIAAGTLENTERDLRRWILDPQRFKPGSKMPGLEVPGDDLRALVAYLRSLE